MSKTYVHLVKRDQPELPPEFRDDDVRFSDSLVEYLLERYTRPGDRVLDPFAGFGTTLRVAEALGRVAYGVEYDARRVEYVRGQLQRPENLIRGDSRQLADYDLPPMDFSLSSPPYMGPGDSEDPLTAYSRPGQGYVTYLEDLCAVYVQVAELLQPAGKLVIEVSNMKRPAGVVTLAWDLAHRLSQRLPFEGELVFCWDHATYGYDHTYCLVFGRPYA